MPDELEPDLRRLMRCLRGGGEAAHGSRIDAHGLVREVFSGVPPGRAAGRLADLVGQALGCAAADIARLRPGAGCQPAFALAAATDVLYSAAIAIDPRAVEILYLGLEGCSEREIAEHLSTGARLVRRIKADLRQALAEPGASC